MSSLTAACLCYRCQLTGSEVIELFKIYALLMGSLCGVYQGVQSFSDVKKIKGGV